MKALLQAFLSIVLVIRIAASVIATAENPPADAFRILPPVSKEGPAITAYLRYQTEVAWQQDELRRRRWSDVHTEQDLLRLQQELRKHLLEMLGGLPTVKTPLNPQITGRIAMQGFHIDKVVFESLPHIYVSALVYVPDDGPKKHPGVLVPAGHSPNGKAYYQALCQRLVKRGYVVIAWDPVGQGERSQFWDAENQKSRYNLICAEHAVLGNLAYLAGTSLARWEIWDGIRALDYLLTLPEVDPNRINITGTSGGGTQTALIAALDPRIKVAAPSCYITALPMRVYNRIFKDPDSDPEQDLYGMISEGIGHPGLLLLMYPRPVFVAAATLDFFPIDGTYKTFSEVSKFYSRFANSDRIAMHETYNGHQFSPENQEFVIEFLDHFNGMPVRHEMPPVHEIDDKTLQVTRTGQVMLDYPDARSLMDVIHDYYVEHKATSALTLKQLYYSDSYPGITKWSVAQYEGAIAADQIQWESKGNTVASGISIDRYLLHHSRDLEMPLLCIHKLGGDQQKILIWQGENGKLTPNDWPEVQKYLDDGYDIVSVDPRGLGEMRMPYKAASPDDPSLAQLDFDRAYVSPISGVLADYVYNSLLTGRPYFLQMIEDVEIAERFAKSHLGSHATFLITGEGNASTLASAVSEILPDVKLLPAPDSSPLKWSEIVDQKTELWPIQYLLPGGAYIK
ncbi:MAG TPA: acetylxylan esterase [Terriglobales bacterium]|nr:acetylxylan esterase [Terriglobales bacterium]